MCTTGTTKAVFPEMINIQLFANKKNYHLIVLILAISVYFGYFFPILIASRLHATMPA